MKRHETHGHLDLLWLRMNNFEETRGIEVFGDWSVPDEFQGAVEGIRPLIQDHVLFIQPGVSNANTALNVLLWKDIVNVSCLIGAHPEIVTQDFSVVDFMKEQDELLQRLSLLNLYQKIVGVGECGLDYYYTQDVEIIAKQKELFRLQIQRALELKVPLVIHSRDAFEDTFAILDDFPDIYGKFEIHCFTGGVFEMQNIVKRGGYIGVGGIVTFKNAIPLQEAVKVAPFERVLLETDLPFLAPTPHRGDVCKPEYVDLVQQKIEKLHSECTFHQLQTNAQRLFFNV